METKQMIRIEYIEPGVRVKELRRRRCVVASYTNAPGGTHDGFSDDTDNSYTFEDE